MISFFLYRPNDAFVRQLIEFEKELQKERVASDA